MSESHAQRDAIDFARSCLPQGPGLRDLEATLRRVDPAFATVLRSFGTGVVQGSGRLRLRCMGALFQFAAVQLADDLADGDCDYLEPAGRAGPGAQWMLQHLSVLAFAGGGVPPHALMAAARMFLRVGAAQQDEVRRRRWDLDSATEAAAALNGQQYAAYLTLLWAGSDWEQHAQTVGQDFGFSLHVVTDQVSQDPRWVDLSQAEQTTLLEEARACAARCQQQAPAGAQQHLAWLLRQLQSAAA